MSTMSILHQTIQDQLSSDYGMVCDYKFNSGDAFRWALLSFGITLLEASKTDASPLDVHEMIMDTLDELRGQEAPAEAAMK